MIRSSASALLKENQPLAPFTTLGVGGPARFFMEARAEGQVLDAFEFAEERGCPLFVLGGGSNLLVSDDGFPGLVLRIALKGVWFDEKEEGCAVAAAGEDWDSFVLRCVEQNLSGVECLSGIPGTVGGTPIQNVGAYGQDVSQSIVSVSALDRKTREVRQVRAAECGFSYRSSLFNSEWKNRYVILSVAYALRPGGSPCIRYADLRERFAGERNPPSIAEIRRAVLEIRAGKGMLIRAEDPDSRSAGSFFKNVLVSVETARRVEEVARRRGSLAGGQGLPGFGTPEGVIKLPAAWLIEKSGFARGYARGRVGLSSKHALAIVNRGGATAREVLDLVREIQSGVREAFGLDLVPEPVFVGFKNRC